MDFGLSMKELEILNSRKNLILTQSLSEDKIMTEAKKIELYGSMIKKHNSENIVIKIHRRDKTDYRNLFKEVLVLDIPILFEIFTLLNLKIERAITYSSTSIYSLEHSIEKIFLSSVE